MTGGSSNLQQANTSSSDGGSDRDEDAVQRYPNQFMDRFRPHAGAGGGGDAMMMTMTNDCEEEDGCGSGRQSGKREDADADANSAYEDVQRYLSQFIDQFRPAYAGGKETTTMTNDCEEGGSDHQGMDADGNIASVEVSLDDHNGGNDTTMVLEKEEGGGGRRRCLVYTARVAVFVGVLSFILVIGITKLLTHSNSGTNEVDIASAAMIEGGAGTDTNGLSNTDDSSIGEQQQQQPGIAATANPTTITTTASMGQLFFEQTYNDAALSIPPTREPTVASTGSPTYTYVSGEMIIPDDEEDIIIAKQSNEEEKSPPPSARPTSEPIPPSPIIITSSERNDETIVIAQLQSIAEDTLPPSSRPPPATSSRPITRTPTYEPTMPYPTYAPTITTEEPTLRPTTKPPTSRPTTKSPTMRPTTGSPTQSPLVQIVYGQELHSTLSGLGIEVDANMNVRVIAKRDKALGSGGLPFHGMMDGAGIIRLPSRGNGGNGGGYVYVSNSKKGGGQGGVYGLYFDKRGRIVDYKQLLTGTSRNSGGGLTPWNTWISCEERESIGQCWQVDPDPSSEHHATPQKTILGGANGGSYDSAAVDNANPDKPVFFVTEDFFDGPVRRIETDGNGWSSLNGGGTTTYLRIVDEYHFEWTSDEPAARDSARLNYPNAEGITCRDGRLYFVTKYGSTLFTLDLNTMKYVTEGIGQLNHFGWGSPFEAQPDQIVFGPRGENLYFNADGSETHFSISATPGVYYRKTGTYYTILQGIPGGKYTEDKTVGLAFSPDRMRMYVGMQKAGVLLELTREDGEEFEG